MTTPVMMPPVMLEIPRAVNDWMTEHPDSIYTRGRNGTAIT
jgi:hypothetical protein